MSDMELLVAAVNNLGNQKLINPVTVVIDLIQREPRELY